MSHNITSADSSEVNISFSTPSPTHPLLLNCKDILNVRNPKITMDLVTEGRESACTHTHTRKRKF